MGVTGSGDKEVVERFKHFKRLNVVIHVGPVFTLPPLDSKNRDEQLASYTEEIMCRIAAELPESYRGIYADHPRLHELLAEKAARNKYNHHWWWVEVTGNPDLYEHQPPFERHP